MSQECTYYWIMAVAINIPSICLQPTHCPSLHSSLNFNDQRLPFC